MDARMANASRSRERPAPSPSGKIDFGLGNVDQSADASTPVSTATQPALNAKVDTSGFGSASGLSSAGGDLPANRTIDAPQSTNPPAVAGADDTTAMMPFATKDANQAFAAPDSHTGLVANAS
jgi:hypothetical protein